MAEKNGRVIIDDSILDKDIYKIGKDGKVIKRDLLSQKRNKTSLIKDIKSTKRESNKK